MPAIAESIVIFGSMLGGWEIILILAVVLILLGAKKLPDISRGFGRGLFEFRKALDDEAHEAGKSIGGIYGKGAAQALTPDNQTAELYDPAALENEQTDQGKDLKKDGLLLRIWRFFANLVKKTILRIL